MAEASIVYPFQFDSYGKVATTTDQRLIWQQRVRFVLFTRIKERVMSPAFGSHALKYLFETEEVAQEGLTRSISQAFGQWLPALILTGVNPKYDGSSGQLTITVSYTLPSGEQDSFTGKTSVFNRYGDLIQEIERG